MNIVTCERYDELWQAVLAECGQLEQRHGSAEGGRRTGAMIDQDGRGLSVILEIGHGDGTGTVCHIKARLRPATRAIGVSADTWLNNHDQFWEMQSAQREGAVVIGHEQYRIKPDLPARDSDLAGHGGRLFRIRMTGGEIIETRNLWYQGVIPPAWRDRLPDDAEFVKEPVACTCGKVIEVPQ